MLLQMQELNETLKKIGQVLVKGFSKGEDTMDENKESEEEEEDEESEESESDEIDDEDIDGSDDEEVEEDIYDPEVVPELKKKTPKQKAERELARMESATRKKKKKR